MKLGYSKRAVVHETQKAAIRSLIVTVMGVAWFFVTPWIFIWGLPQFNFYTQWLTNYYGSSPSLTSDVTNVYQFWTLVPEFVLFFFGIFWAGGLFEKIGSWIS